MKKNDKDLFNGVIFDVQEVPFGKINYQVVHKHKNAVCILAVIPARPGLKQDGIDFKAGDKRKIIMVEQTRPAVRGKILELPAGVIEPGEDPKETALRELEEETGYTSDSVKKIASFYSSPGYTDEKIDLFVANNCYKVPEETRKPMDDDEDISVHLMRMEDLIEIQDKLGGKTLLGLFYYSMSSGEKEKWGY